MMDKMLTFLNTRGPAMLSVLRIVVALVFMEHGTQKLLAFPDGKLAGMPFGSLVAWSGVIELGTGALMALGLFTRPAAFLASGTMAVAYWVAHAPRDFFPVNNGGDAAILYCFLFLYLVFAGPGPWSLDARLAQRRPTA